MPCDGKTECHDRRDESFCSLEDYIEIVILIAIVVIIMAATFVMKRAIMKNCQPIDQNQTLTKDNFLTLHGTEDLKTKMQQIQSCESSKNINQQFALWEIDQHGGNTNETVLCIKVKSALICATFSLNINFDCVSLSRTHWIPQQQPKSWQKSLVKRRTLSLVESQKVLKTSSDMRGKT